MKHPLRRRVSMAIQVVVLAVASSVNAQPVLQLGGDAPGNHDLGETVAIVGDFVGLSPLPPPLPLRVQLQARNGICWESTHSVARTSTATRFSSRSD